MAKKRLPRFRDVQRIGDTVTYGYLWRDDRDGTSAIITKLGGVVDRAILSNVFLQARSEGFPVSIRRPLIVHSVVCLMGETDTFRFVQIDPKGLSALAREVQA